MKISACLITLITLFCNCSFAQFHVSYAPKDAFSSALIKVLNAAPNNFETIKSKKLIASDTTIAVYLSKVRMPSTSNASVLIKGETIVAYFSLGTYDHIRDAESVLVNATKDIASALMQQVLIKNTDSTEAQGIMKQTDIALITTNGFYDYNISVAIKKDTNYHVVLNIRGGDPLFYYTIPAMPVRSGYFNAGFLTNTRAFINNSLYGCNGDIPGFTCNTFKDSSFTPLVQYVKYDDSEPHAFFEFDNALTNIKSCLGSDYVYYFNKAVGDTRKIATFIKRADIEKMNKKSISLKLTETDSQLFEVAIDFTPAVANDKTYATEY